MFKKDLKQTITAKDMVVERFIQFNSKHWIQRHSLRAEQQWIDQTIKNITSSGIANWCWTYLA